jgi:hypothetical protein
LFNNHQFMTTYLSIEEPKKITSILLWPQISFNYVQCKLLKMQNKQFCNHEHTNRTLKKGKYKVKFL